MPRLVPAFEQFFDGSGDPLVDGLLDFFESGSSSVRKTTYADSGETILNANPVVLGADGRAPDIFGTGNFRAILRTSAGVQVLQRDPVGGDQVSQFGADWVSTQTYSLTEVVRDAGRYWESQANNNLGNRPSTDDGTNWTEAIFSATANIALSGVVFDLISDLRSNVLASGTLATIKGHTSINDGGGGEFVYTTGAAPGTYVDNNGIIIVPTGGDGSAAWLRVFSGRITDLWFGVTADGSTDDTTNMQAALDVAAGTAGLWSPAGTRMIDAKDNPLDVPTNTNWLLDHNAEMKAIINDADAYAVIKIGIDAANAGEAGNRSNITISGGKVTGDKDDHAGATGEAGHCIYLRNCQDVHISNMRITEGWGDGIYLGCSQGVYRGQDTSPINVTIDDCHVTDNSRNNISVVCGENILIDGVECARADRTNPKAGIDVEPSESGLFTQNVKIVNCELHDNDGRGIDIIDSDAQGDIENVIVRGNTIHSNVGGVIIKATNESDAITIDGNHISKNTGHQVYLNGSIAGYIEGNIDITNNAIFDGVDSGTEGDGIFITGSNVLSVTVKGNRVYKNPRHGIHVNGTSAVDEILIADNFVHGNSQLTDATYNNIYVEGSAHYINIINNMVREDVFSELTNGAAYGIRVDDNDQTYIHGNDVVEGGKTANMLIANIRTTGNSSNHWVWDNKGYQTEAILKSDVFLVDSAAVRTVTIAHGLPYTPDIGQITFSLLADTITDNTIIITAWVASVDATNITITVNITDPSGNSGNDMRVSTKVTAVRPS